MSNDEENQPKMIASKDRIENQIYISQELMNKINDNPVYEQYRSRSISNYAQAIKTLMEVDRNERQMGNSYSCKK